VALRWAGVRGVCGGQIRAIGGNWRACPGWRRNHGGDPEEADRAQQPRAILAWVAELLERRWRLGRGPECGLGCGAEELPQSAAERGHGQRRAAGPAGKKQGRGKEKGEEDDARAPASRGRKRERRHAALGSGQGGKGGERSADGPPEKKKAGPRGKRELGRAAEKRRGKATRVRKEREGLGLLGWLLLFLPFLFLFPDFPNLTQFNLNPNRI
jgi:hypothetical protein